MSDDSTTCMRLRGELSRLNNLYDETYRSWHQQKSRADAAEARIDGVIEEEEAAVEISDDRPALAALREEEPERWALRKGGSR